MPIVATLEHLSVGISLSEKSKLLRRSYECIVRMTHGEPGANIQLNTLAVTRNGIEWAYAGLAVESKLHSFNYSCEFAADDFDLLQTCCGHLL
jgi:hypothetical protein